MSTDIILKIVKQCFADRVQSPEGHERMKAMVPGFDVDLSDASQAGQQKQWSDEAVASLNLG